MQQRRIGLNGRPTAGRNFHPDRRATLWINQVRPALGIGEGQDAGTQGIRGVQDKQSAIHVADDHRSAGKERIHAPSPGKAAIVILRKRIEPADLEGVHRIVGTEDAQAGVVFSLVNETTVDVEIVIDG